MRHLPGRHHFFWGQDWLQSFPVGRPGPSQKLLRHLGGPLQSRGGFIHMGHEVSGIDPILVHAARMRMVCLGSHMPDGLQPSTNATCVVLLHSPAGCQKVLNITDIARRQLTASPTVKWEAGTTRSECLLILARWREAERLLQRGHRVISPSLFCANSCTIFLSRLCFLSAGCSGASSGRDDRVFEQCRDTIGAQTAGHAQRLRPVRSTAHLPQQGVTAIYLVEIYSAPARVYGVTGREMHGVARGPTTMVV